MLSRQPRLLLRSGALAAIVASTLAVTDPAMASTQFRTPHLAALPGHVTAVVSHGEAEKTFTIPARPGRYSLSAGSAHAVVVRRATNSPLTTITCTLSVTNPQYIAGPPYGQNVEGSAETDCTATVSVLYVGVGLYFNGTLGNDSYAENFNVSTTSVLTKVDYVAGYYQDGAVATIEYPAGYSPSSQNIGPIYSSDVYIFHT